MKQFLLCAPRRKVADRGPKDLDISNGHLVCLDNIGAFTPREPLEEALRTKNPGLRVCTCTRPLWLMCTV